MKADKTPAPSSSPLETASQLCHACGMPAKKANRLGNNKLMLSHDCPHGRKCAASDRKMGLHVNHNVTCSECLKRPAESSPKSPFETQTGRIFAQLNAICFHSKMHGDCVGCLLGHAERLEIALNEQATPSPEPPRQIADLAERLANRIADEMEIHSEDSYFVPLERIKQIVRELVAPSSHSGPELVKLREALQLIWRSALSAGGGTGGVYRQIAKIAEAALASTPQNEPK